MHRLSSPSLAAAAALALLNALVVVALWGPAVVRDIHDTASLLTGLGRVTGLLGAYLALVSCSCSRGSRCSTPRRLARSSAPLERLRLPDAARRARDAITAGYTLGDRISLAGRGLAAARRLSRRDHRDRRAVRLIAVTVDLGGDRAPPAALRDVVLRPPVRLPRRALAFSHQLATGSSFVATAGGARVLVRALRGDARRAGRVPARAARCGAARATGCAWCG